MAAPRYFLFRIVHQMAPRVALKLVKLILTATRLTRL